jgi:hypothetical protein
MDARTPLRKRLRQLPAALLYDREQASAALNVSTATIIRMEERGVLTPVKPGGRSRGTTFYRVQEIRRVAGLPEEGE